MKSILITLVLAAGAVLVQAQPEGGNPPGGPRPGGPDGPRRPVPPLLAALDADKDGELSAGEIANAAIALKVLDKDSDGKISKEELRPPMPPRGEGDGKGEGRPPHEGAPRKEGALRFDGDRRPEGRPASEGRGPREHRRGPVGPPPADRG